MLNSFTFHYPFTIHSFIFSLNFRFHLHRVSLLSNCSQNDWLDSEKLTPIYSIFVVTWRCPKWSNQNTFAPKFYQWKCLAPLTSVTCQKTALPDLVQSNRNNVYSHWTELNKILILPFKSIFAFLSLFTLLNSLVTKYHFLLANTK